MADPNQAQKAESQRVAALLYPPPPPFYKHFTPENIGRVKELQAAAEPSGASGSIADGATTRAKLLALPPELRYLVPPEPPADGTYRAFGQIHNVNAPVFSIPHDLEKLYPSSPAGSTTQTGSEWTLDRAYYLKKMARAMLLNFLELVGILSQNPAEFGDKILHLNTLLVNMHQLINDYRPHQARETLITMMEDQLEKKRTEVEGIKRMREKIDQMLEGLRKGTPEAEVMTDIENEISESPEELAIANQRCIWDTLDEELGV